MRSYLVLALVVAGCSPAEVRTDAAGAAPRDAAIDSHDAVLDAPPDANFADAGPPLRRDPHPACGVWSYDLDDSTTYDTPEELTFAIADARCQLQLRCALPTYFCAGWGFDPPTLYRSPVDVALARTCLADIEHAECLLAYPPSCVALTQAAARAPVGAACDDRNFCVEGPCSDMSGACTGTCLGTSCPDCGPDAYCPPSEYQCRPRPVVGQYCEGYECAAGLACDGFAALCVHEPIAGEPCAVTFDPYSSTSLEWCPSDLVCDAHTCVVPSVAAVGEPCGGTTVCDVGADCSSGRCVAQPGPGEACATTFPSCAPGLICDRSRRCGTPVGPGCACDDTTSCPPGFWCDAGTCTSLLVSTPATCSDATGCFGVNCVGGACVLPVEGAPCSDAYGCLFGYCSTRTNTCVPYIPIGGDCSVEHRCVVGAGCVGGVCALVGTACYTPTS